MSNHPNIALFRRMEMFELKDDSTYVHIYKVMSSLKEKINLQG